MEFELHGTYELKKNASATDRGKKRTVIQMAKDIPQYFDELGNKKKSPDYTKRSVYGGGCNSSAICSPTALKAMGTDADSSKPSAIVTARNKYPTKNFKAGHLLNADFGGSGTDYKNLTILTAQANTRHQNFDNPVKTALQTLKELYDVFNDNYIDIENVRIGIRIEVTVADGTWGDDSPDKYIYAGLGCSAQLRILQPHSDMQTFFEALEPYGCGPEFKTKIGAIEQLLATANANGVIANSK